VGALSLRLFGVLQLERDGGGVVRLPTKKTSALLAYLALHGRQPQSRAKLAALLWEDSAEPQARESLRQTLSLLRKAFSPELEDRLIAHGDNVALDLRDIPVDTAQFEQLASSAEISTLERAARLYSGQVLEGFDLRAPEFEAWLRAVRQQFHERALDVLSRLLAHHIAAGNLEGGVTVATRLLALDPLREDAHRILIELYGRQGRFPAAFQQYRYCEEVLSRELGVEPEAATKALYRRVRELRDQPEQPAAVLAPLSASMGQSVAVQPLERKQITILSCGLLGLARLSEQLEPEEVHALAAAYRQRCNEIVAPFGGMMGAIAGDDLTVYFGLREANELSAERALRAALAMSEELPRLDAKFSAAIDLRIGIATGAVVIGQFKDGAERPLPALLGEAPKLAMWLQSVAGPGGTVISTATRILVGDLFECRPLAVSTMPGAEPVEAWLVVGESARQSRFEAIRASNLTPFIGRKAELEQLLIAWREARSGGGHTYLITGDPGIGKSRLTQMCFQRVGKDPHRTFLFQCSPFHTQSALYPFIRHLERAAGFKPEDGAAEKLAKLETLLAGVSWRVTGLVSLMADLLSLPLPDRYSKHGLNPAQQRRKTMAALLEWIEGSARQGPLLINFEDAHWADASSLELLDQLVERIAHAPVLLLVTSRPGIVLAWDCLDHVRKMPLAGLDDDDASVMVRMISGEGNLPQDVQAGIATRTDGVPLYVEELTRATMEARGGAAGKRTFLVPRFGAALTIPSSLQDSLAARIDRLGTAKPLAQTASVIGRDFSPALLAEVVGVTPDELRDALAMLTESGLVQEQPSGGEGKLAFKHGLVQEAAYRSLPKSRRQQLHAAVAAAILQASPGETASRPELLAHHYSEAGMLRGAISQWLEAGRLAIVRSANVEASAHLARGLDLIRNATTLSVQERNHWEVRFLTTLGPATMAIHGYAAPEGQQVYERADELIDDTTSEDDRMQVLAGLWNVKFGRSDLRAARPLAFEYLRAAEAAGRGILLANCMVGQTISNMGEFEPARKHLQFVIDAYDEARRKGDDVTFGVDELVLALSYMSPVLWALGDPMGAARMAKEAADRVHEGMNSVTTATAMVAYLFVATQSKALDEAQALVEQALTYCQENDLNLFENWIRIHQGTLLVKRGRTSEGIAMMEAAIAASEKMQSRLFRPFHLGSLARAYLKAGDVGRALAETEGAIAMADITGERQAEVGLRRMRGEILMAIGRKAEGQEELARAVKLAEQQGVRGEIARLKEAKT
jgi:DNA-binding SARP family transcriptional activator/tetratricopeptide (TPR) repeat protein